MVRTAIAALFLISATISAQEEPTNYCHDKAIWQKIEKMVKDAPEDPVAVRLYALRSGFCDMIEKGLIALQTGFNMFETEKAKPIFNSYARHWK